MNAEQIGFMPGRFEAATAALEAYVWVTDRQLLAECIDGDWLSFQPALSDLLADLMHLVGGDIFARVLYEAATHYQVESSDDGEGQ